MIFYVLMIPFYRLHPCIGKTLFVYQPPCGCPYLHPNTCFHNLPSWMPKLQTHLQKRAALLSPILLLPNPPLNIEMHTLCHANWWYLLVFMFEPHKKSRIICSNSLTTLIEITKRHEKTYTHPSSGICVSTMRVFVLTCQLEDSTCSLIWSQQLGKAPDRWLEAHSKHNPICHLFHVVFTVVDFKHFGFLHV